jgi:hypothetical protein
MDQEQITAMIAALLGGGVITKVTDYLLKRKKQQADADQLSDLRADQTYQYAMGELRGECNRLRAEIEAVKRHEIECNRRLGELEGRMLEQEKSRLRHEDANKQHVELLTKEVEKIKTGQEQE